MTNDYVKDDTLNLYRRAEYTGIAYSDGDDTERRIYAVVSRAIDRSTFSAELAQATTDRPSEYYLSRQRHCLVRPLGIKSGEKVLELGCGCGAITRFLGELGAEVTGVEGSLPRARIASERCRNLPNVRIIADDLLQFKTDERFDWVLLIGVLEYAPVFSANEAPILHYLRRASEFLTLHGRLVVAIENKLGLKYFNGSGEDHLGVPFFGIQGLYAANTPCTFGRRELEAYIRSAGLHGIDFHYPFPDYKLPRVIIFEAGLSDPLFDAAQLLAFTSTRDHAGRSHRAFDEALVSREVVRNGLLGELSNSFLVVATKQPQGRTNPRVLAVSYAVQRLSEFAAETCFLRSGDKIRVLKEPLCQGVSHQHRFTDGSTIEQRTGECEYVSGDLLLWRLRVSRAKGAKLTEIVEAFQPWFDFLLQQRVIAPAVPDDQAGDGKQNLSQFVMPGWCLDLTPSNLIEAGEHLVPIDMEWRMDHDIQLGWVVTRSVLSSLYNIGDSETAPVRTRDVIKALCTRRGLSVRDTDIDEWLCHEQEFLTAVAGQPAETSHPAHSSLIMRVLIRTCGRILQKSRGKFFLLCANAKRMVAWLRFVIVRRGWRYRHNRQP